MTQEEYIQHIESLNKEELKEEIKRLEGLGYKIIAKPHENQQQH